MSFVPRSSITNRIAAALTDIERARGFLDATTLSDAWIHAMQSTASLLEAHHATHIEVTQLTIDEAAELLAGASVPSADPDDARELLNYRDAFEFVSRNLNDGGPITESLVREIHHRLVAGRPWWRCRARRVANHSELHHRLSHGRCDLRPAPPADDVPELMRDLIRCTNHPHDVHPVIASAIAQFQLVHIHPFLDGNGRTSRLLSMLCLYRAGYDFKRLFAISEYHDQDRVAFYNAIQSVRQMQMDMTRWIEFFTHGLATQRAEVKQRGEVAMRQDVLARRHALTGRQVVALGAVLAHGWLTIAEFQDRVPGAPRRTLQRDLRALVEKGALKRCGRTNRLEYVLAGGAVRACVKTCATARAKLAPPLVPPAGIPDASPRLARLRRAL